MTVSPQTMYLDAMSGGDIFKIDNIGDFDCFFKYRDNPDSRLSVDKVVRYVILLYSKDSILNRKPMPPLPERRMKAATLAGFDTSDDQVVSLLFDLLSEQVRDLILDYLISINSITWTERCIVEAQMQENQRIRLKPIQNKVIKPLKKNKKKKDEDEDDDDLNHEDDDKYIIEASNKKYSLTDHFDKYHELLKKYDAEIFADHDVIKKHAIKRARRSIESMSQ